MRQMHYTMIKRSIQMEGITTINIYAPTSENLNTQNKH